MEILEKCCIFIFRKRLYNRYRLSYFHIPHPVTVGRVLFFGFGYFCELAYIYIISVFWYLSSLLLLLPLPVGRGFLFVGVLPVRKKCTTEVYHITG